MNYSEMEKKLEKILPEKRLKHSLNVSKCAVKLSEIYDCDIEKARIAGLVHDCAKYFSEEQILYYILKYSIELEQIEKNNIALSHSIIGSYAVEELFDIHDDDIKSAIKYHTTGRENMTLLEKIIYIADLIEEGREFPNVEKLRSLTFSGKLDEALILSFNNTIKFVIERNQLIHLRTISARNYLLKNRM